MSLVGSSQTWVGLASAADRIIGDTRRMRSSGRRPLRVLLTNSDGWDALGIRSVQAALQAAGHEVVVVAPADNQSGAGARVSLSGQLVERNERLGVYAVAGSPADAAAFGLDVVFSESPPDLVVAGANNGQNVGAMALHSGAVGAIATVLRFGVPGIAASSEIDLETALSPTNGQPRSPLSSSTNSLCGQGMRGCCPLALDSRSTFRCSGPVGAYRALRSVRSGMASSDCVPSDAALPEMGALDL